MPPDTSIVISTYNRPRLLARTLRSALSQTWQDIEVLVVDNGSDDETAAFLATVTDPRLRIIRNEESLGATGGRNTGLMAARGTWVAMLDDDDLWAPTKVQAQREAVAQRGADWAVTGCVYIDGDDAIIGGMPPQPSRVMARSLLWRNTIPGGMSNVLWRRAALDDDGLLDPRLQLTTDWDVGLRLLRLGPPVVVRQPLVAYRQHFANLSRRAIMLSDEFAIIESKFADLIGGGRIDRAYQYRFAAGEALRVGARRDAATGYLLAFRGGDAGAIPRMAAVALPQSWQPVIRRRLLSNAAWVQLAESWLRDRVRGEAVAASITRRPEVVVLQRSLRKYREPFYHALKAELDRSGIDLRLVHALRPEAERRGDPGVVHWSEPVRVAGTAFGGGSLTWLAAWHLARGADLVIVEQATGQLINYPLLARARCGRGRVAFWGHGQDFGRTSSADVGEAVKRWMSRYVDWWFPYTEASAEIVRRLGYPPERISVVRNATDTRGLIADLESIDQAQLDAVRTMIGLDDGPVLLFLGAVTPAKRLDILMGAADRVRARMPDVQLVVTGDGDRRADVERWALSRPWVHVTGPVFGHDKAALLKRASAVLVPGWVGLVVVDCFAAGVPIITLGGVPHPPEFAYIHDGVDGLVVPGSSEEDYAEAVVELLHDGPRRTSIAAGARQAALRYSSEDMAARFAEGIRRALRH